MAYRSASSSASPAKANGLASQPATISTTTAGGRAAAGAPTGGDSDRMDTTHSQAHSRAIAGDTSDSSAAATSDEDDDDDRRTEERTPKRTAKKPDRRHEQAGEGAPASAPTAATGPHPTAPSSSSSSTLPLGPISPRKPPPGYINFSPRKLRLPETHQPWGRAYEHPTLLSPSGKPLELAPGFAPPTATAPGHGPTPIEAAAAAARDAKGHEKSENLLARFLGPRISHTQPQCAPSASSSSAYASHTSSGNSAAIGGGLDLDDLDGPDPISRSMNGIGGIVTPLNFPAPWNARPGESEEEGSSRAFRARSWKAHEASGGSLSSRAHSSSGVRGGRSTIGSAGSGSLSSRPHTQGHVGMGGLHSHPSASGPIYNRRTTTPGPYGSSGGLASPRSASASGYGASSSSRYGASGFFPSNSPVAGGYASSFHASLGHSARVGASAASSSAGGGMCTSTAAFHRVLPPSFMNVPLRVETLTLAAARIARARLHVGASSFDARWSFQGAIVKDRQQAKKKKERERIERERQAQKQAKMFGGYPPLWTRTASAKASQEEEKDQSASAPNTARSASGQSGAPSSAPLPQPSELDLSLAHSAIRDYSIRALACRRAGRRSAEANAQYCMGVLWDNVGEYLKAIDCYRMFKEILCAPKHATTTTSQLHASRGRGGSAGLAHAQFDHQLRTADDVFAEALAHNSLGVSFQNLGPAHYPDALYHHARHRDIGDTPGQFIAYTNLGLIYQLMAQDAKGKSAGEAGVASGPTSSSRAGGGGGAAAAAHDDESASSDVTTSYTEAAAYNHQQALRCAIKMSSLAGQNIAIGNLGLTGLQHQDLQTARACMERHLQLSQNLDDYRGQSAAYQSLGTIASQQGQHEEAMIYYQSAAQMAHVLRDTTTADITKVQVGVARANANMDVAMRRMAEMMTTEPTSNT